MDLTIRPMTPQERHYCYSQSAQIESQCGCIGHLRGDMGDNGEEFYTSWTDDTASYEKTDAFKTEFDHVIGALRFDEKTGKPLKDIKSMGKFCYAHAGSLLSEGRGFGFRADTQLYTYMIRLDPTPGAYNVYCYCYKRLWLEQHLAKAAKGIRFITPQYEEKFRIEDGDKIRVTKLDGQTEEKVCRYIDPYHTEIGSNIFHICEYAEMIEHTGATVIPIRASLPEWCYAALPSTGEVVVVKRGEMGYKPEIGTWDTKSGPRYVANGNAAKGVSKAQEAAMLAGSMFGWDTPAADPKNYDDEGRAIKPRHRELGDAR